jgi:catechol 2,3-dioxygenase-like lactoylglutathione lyase family enzyme
MFTHVTVGTNDKAASVAFYDATFGALGISGQPTENGAFYGSPQTGAFGVTKPRDGEPATYANGGTIGLQAANPAAVDAWHAAGLANGGTSEGEPGLREYGPAPMYGAYMRDPVGNKLCAFTTNVEG